MSITPLSFTGISQFSTDFQTILNRAVSIASLPITALQNQQANILSENQLTTSLEGVIADLAASVTNLGGLGSSQSLSGASSDTSKVTIAGVSGGNPASYAITNISSVAAAASETSLIGYADAATTPVSASGTVKLVVGGASKEIQLGAGQNNLVGLRDAINAAGFGATATILTTGTGATPNYLSLSTNSTGATTLQLIENPDVTPIQLLTSANQGADAIFQLNGADVTSHSNLINNVVPGVSFSIAGKTDLAQTVTLSLSSDPSQLATALQDFVTKYNAVSSQLNAQIGPAAGLLSGNSLIWNAQSVLRGLLNFNGTGNTKSLSDLGVEMSSSGQMSFNQTTFNGLNSSQISDGFQFLGSATSGFGALASQLTQLSDPITGLIKLQQDQYTAADTRLTAQVSTLTDHVNSMQASLSAKLQAADALIANLNSQQQFLTATLQGSNFTAFGSAPVSPGFNNTLNANSSSSSG